MFQLPVLPTMERLIRARVCPQCEFRPAGTERLGPDIPRPCQSTCNIFENLPRLHEVAQEKLSSPTTAYERALRGVVCQACRATSAPLDPCLKHKDNRCPLRLYHGEVLSALEMSTDLCL